MGTTGGGIAGGNTVGGIAGGNTAVGGAKAAAIGAAGTTGAACTTGATSGGAIGAHDAPLGGVTVSSPARMFAARSGPSKEEGGNADVSQGSPLPGRLSGQFRPSLPHEKGLRERCTENNLSAPKGEARSDQIEALWSRRGPRRLEQRVSRTQCEFMSQRGIHRSTEGLPRSFIYQDETRRAGKRRRANEFSWAKPYWAEPCWAFRTSRIPLTGRQEAAWHDEVSVMPRARAEQVRGGAGAAASGSRTADELPLKIVTF